MVSNFQYFLLSTSALALFGSTVLTLLIVRKNPFHLSIPFLCLNLLFYFYPFFQFVLGADRYYSIFEAYNVWPSKDTVALTLCFSAINFLFIAFLFLIFSSRQIGCRVPQYSITWVKIKLILILSVILLLLFQAYSNFDAKSILYLLSPARKELDLSGAQRALLSLFPVLFAVIAFNKKKSFLRFCSIFLVILLVVFVLGQRRQIIMISLFCILFNYREHVYVSRQRATYIFSWLAALAVTIVPLAWYLRTYSTRLLNDTWNASSLLEIRSPLDLILGSSTKGFESLFLQSDHIANGALSLFHSSKFALLSFVPRALLPDKPKSIPAAIAEYNGTEGSTSTFFMSEVFTDFSLAMPLFSVVFCFIYSQLDKLRSKGLTGFVIYLVLWSNSVQLYKNGWASSFPFYCLAFSLVFIFFYKAKVKRVGRIEG